MVKDTKSVGNECRVFCLSVWFFIPSLIFNFDCQFAVSLYFFRLCITVGGMKYSGLRSCVCISRDKP